MISTRNLKFVSSRAMDQLNVGNLCQASNLFISLTISKGSRRQNMANGSPYPWKPMSKFMLYYPIDMRNRFVEVLLRELEMRSKIQQSHLTEFRLTQTPIIRIAVERVFFFKILRLKQIIFLHESFLPQIMKKEILYLHNYSLMSEDMKKFR